MANPAGVRAKIDAALRTKLGPSIRTAYLRTRTVTGDKLIGRETVTTTDTLLNPQPLFTTVREEMMINGNKQIVVGDYKILLSANAVTEDQLKDPGAQIVLKAANGDTDVLRILYYRAPSLQGQAVLYTVFARSTA